MKKVLFFLSVFLMLLVAVSCKNPVDTSVDTDEPSTTESTDNSSNEETPVEKPLSDNYIYLGDMLFATTMDFNAWKFTNGTYNPNGFTGKVLVTKLIKKVTNTSEDNSTKIIRYAPDLDNVTRVYRAGNPTDWYYVEDAAKYEVWISKEFVGNTDYWTDDNILFDTFNYSIFGDSTKVDGTSIKITFSQNELLEDTFTLDWTNSDKMRYYN